MRDDFPARVKEVVAKRTGGLCSNPECRAATTGPSTATGTNINVGVAAHISAASPGGPRFDPALSADARTSIENAIWLCQKCAKLIDSDELRYRSVILQGWKRAAEADALAAIEAPARLQGGSVDPRFARLEALVPKLLAEMRQDLHGNQLVREFVLLNRRWSYWGKDAEFCYFFDDHESLEGAVRLLQNHGLVQDITTSNVARYVFSEELVEYLNRSFSAKEIQPD